MILKVSIIIPTHNRAQVVQKSIQSCLDQTYSKVEVIVVDDASEDNTEEVVSSIKDNRIKYYKVNFRQANKARNFGLGKAKGEYIQFLDSDDYLHHDKLKIQVEDMEKNSSECTVSDFVINDHTTGKTHYHSNEDPVKKLSQFKSIFVSSPLYKKSTITEDFLWHPELDRHQDFEFMLRYFSVNRRVSHIPQPLCYYEYYDGDRISNRYHRGYNYEVFLDHYVKFLTGISSNVALNSVYIRRVVSQIMSKYSYENGRIASAKKALWVKIMLLRCL